MGGFLRDVMKLNLGQRKFQNLRPGRDRIKPVGCRLCGERQGLDAETARHWTNMERHKLYISEHGDDMPVVKDWYGEG